MSTYHLTHLFPLAVSKLFWMRVNRTLAWTLVISPPVQWALHMPFVTGLWIDLAILLAHALLSFALFGKPETKARSFSVTMHVLGFRPRDLSERNRFLLSGYRIALALVPLMLVLLEFKLLAAVTGLLFFYPILRLGVTIAQHVYGGAVNAMRRWGMRGYAGAAGYAVAALYLLTSIINLVR